MVEPFIVLDYAFAVVAMLHDLGLQPEGLPLLVLELDHCVNFVYFTCNFFYFGFE